MADEHASFQEVTVVSLKTIARFCSMLLLLALILTPAGSVRAMPGNTTRVSVATGGGQANSGSFDPSISADGRYVAFVSAATNLVSGDTNNFQDIFVHDRQTGQTTRVSVASDGTQANGHSYAPSISADGRYVAFASLASNLVSGDTNGAWDVFVHDRQTGETTRVSVASDGTQAIGFFFGSSPSISADGRYVAFDSWATNLVSGDTNDKPDVFVHDRQTGQTTRVSVSSDGTQANGGPGWSGNPSSISADGRYVAFHSYADNLVSGDTNSATDIFVHDRQTGVTTRVSIASDGTQANGFSASPSISADGRYVAFMSGATNLVSGDTNNDWDVFVHGREGNIAPTVVSITRADPNPTSAASVTFTVTFSKAVTGVDASDFALTTAGSLSGVSVTSVSGSGSTYSVTVSTGTGTGTLRLDVIDNDTIIDAAGNPLGGSGFGNGNFTDGEIYTIQKAIFLPLVVRLHQVIRLLGGAFTLPSYESRARRKVVLP
jgi:Tol biopolymer transport system component